MTYTVNNFGVISEAEVYIFLNNLWLFQWSSGCWQLDLWFLCLFYKFGLGVQNEAGQRLIVLRRECTGHSKHPLPTIQEKTLHMNITRWSILKSDWLYSLQPKMEKLYTVRKKKDRELTVAQIMNSLFPKSDLYWRKYGKPLDHSGMA